jgi:plastocyanin
MRAIGCGINMTLASRICSSIVALTVPLAASVVTGTVDIVGVHGGGRDPAVVVWLEPANQPMPPLQPVVVRMVQRHKEFQPHVLAIRTGTAVEFPNYDPIFHNAFSNIDGQPFDVGLYAPGSSRRVVFHRAGIVRVFCNIHQSMSAVIVVENTPWMGVSDDHGKFRIAGVPPGQYTLNVFFERATGETLDGLRHKVDVEEETTSLPPIQISGAGYIPAPHRNKYGLDYPPEPGGEKGYGDMP